MAEDKHRDFQIDPRVKDFYLLAEDYDQVDASELEGLPQGKFFGDPSILISFIFPTLALATSSKIGVNCLHGLHQGAQKSTIMIFSLDFSITSETKVASLTLFIVSVVIRFYSSVFQFI